MRLRIFIAFTAICFCLCACKTAANEVINQSVEPVDAEIIDIFCAAMKEIDDLKTEDPIASLRIMFDDIEIYDDEIILDNVPYAKTSLAFSDISKYYGNVFTDKALKWVLSLKYIDVDGILWCSVQGGMTGNGFELDSVEYMYDDTYRGLYKRAFSDELYSTAFSIKMTDGGYRISDIDRRPGAFK